MGFRINTNIGAMNAHRNASQVNMGLDKSLQSLSSGLRINVAADDASGLAIANQLKSQAQGLGQAIRNANDGVGVVQTADGALQEYENIINTVRTKAIQAASDGQSADTRAMIQQDIDRLLEAADDIANQTQFNGQKLLDGSFQNKAFHIGAYASETVNFSVGSVQTDEVGDIKSYNSASTRTALASTDITETADGYQLNSDALTVNGTSVADSLNTLSPTRLTDAASIAAAITDATGLVTEASNVLVAADAIAGGTIDSSNQLKINGVAIADTTVQAGDSDGALVRAINDISDQTGVTASLTSTGKLQLESEDGSNISITTSTETAAVAQESQLDFTGALTAGSISVDVNGTTVTTAFDTNEDTTLTNLASDIQAQLIADGTNGDATVTFDGAGTDGLSIVGDSSGEAYTISNIDLSAATGYTAGTNTLEVIGVEEITAAEASDTITGLTGDNLTDATADSAVAELAATSSTALTIKEGDLVINGVDMAGTYGDDTTAGAARDEFVAALQAISGFEDSTVDVLGNIKLVVNDGQDLNIAGVDAGSGSTFDFSTDVPSGVINESKAGSVEIFSTEGIAMGGTNEAAFGMQEGYQQVKDSGSSLGGVDVTTRNSAEIAILIADSALKQIDSTRSDLGSVQNQLESTIRNISVTQVNVTAAESQIRDVDFAAESANFAKLNILAQSGSYAMSQANAVQQNVLRLLQ